jgi:hypothetical protein
VGIRVGERQIVKRRDGEPELVVAEGNDGGLALEPQPPDPHLGAEVLGEVQPQIQAIRGRQLERGVHPGVVGVERHAGLELESAADRRPRAGGEARPVRVRLGPLGGSGGAHESG